MGHDEFQSGRVEQTNRSIGKVGEEPGSQSLSDRITIGSGSTQLIAASPAVSRGVLIIVPSDAVTGVHINMDGAATVNEALLPPGFVGTINTLDAINMIRGGASDVVVEVLALEVT